MFYIEIEHHLYEITDCENIFMVIRPNNKFKKLLLRVEDISVDKGGEIFVEASVIETTHPLYDEIITEVK